MPHQPPNWEAQIERVSSVHKVKERILRMEDIGDDLAVVPTPNSRWYTKPAGKDPPILEPMQAKVAKYLEQQCGRGASPQSRLVKLKNIVEFRPADLLT